METTAALAIAVEPDEIELAPRFKSFFAARDAFYKAMESGELELTGPQAAIFMHLLTNALFSPSQPRHYGYVVDKMVGGDMIATHTGFSERTVKRVLPELDEAGLISRYRRVLLTGGSKPDEIRVDWLHHGASQAQPGGASLSPSGGASLSPPSLPEELVEESSSCGADAPDDEAAIRAAKSKSNPSRTRASSDYRAAVCRALNEHLDDPLDPRLLPSAAVDLLFRLWPDAQDVPAAEIGYGYLENAAYADFIDGSDRVRSEAAVLANALKSADEATVRSWAERGAQRLAEMDEADRAERERDAEEAAEEARRQEVLSHGVAVTGWRPTGPRGWDGQAVDVWIIGEISDATRYYFSQKPKAKGFTVWRTEISQEDFDRIFNSKEEN